MTQQPVARTEPIAESYFDTTLIDPYRWLEAWQSEESMAWTTGQAQFSRSYLDVLPDRADLLAAVEQVSQSGVWVFNFKLVGEKLFYLRREVGDNVPRLVLRPQNHAPEQTLLNPNTMSGDAHYSIDWYAPSPSGRKVAYGLSQGGSEQSFLHILDLETDTTLPEQIDRTDFGLVEWVDEDHFLYNRLPANRAETGHYSFSGAYLHRLGTDPEQDSLLLGQDRYGVPCTGPDIPMVYASAESDWLVGRVMHGDLNEYSLYIASRTALAHPERLEWRQIVTPEDGVVEFLLQGDTLFLRQHRDAPRYKVTAYDVRHNAAATLVPPSSVVIDEIALAGDYLLIRDMEAGLTTLRRVHLPTGTIEPVPLPLVGSVLEMATSQAQSLAFFRAESWTVSPRL